MRVTKDDREQLIIETKPGFLDWFLLAWMLIMVFFFVKSYLEVPRNMRDVYGSAGVSLFLFFAYAMFYERAVFNFNKISKQLIWKRKRFFKVNEGIVSFSNIKNVVLQNSMSGDSTPNTRIMISTDEQQIPLTSSYIGDDNLCIKIAKKIRQAVNHPDRDLVIESVEEMIRNGQDMEAIRLLRIEKGLSLVEAKEEIQRIKNSI